MRGVIPFGEHPVQLSLDLFVAPAALALGSLVEQLSLVDERT